MAVFLGKRNIRKCLLQSKGLKIKVLKMKLKKLRKEQNSTEMPMSKFAAFAGVWVSLFHAEFDVVSGKEGGKLWKRVVYSTVITAVLMAIYFGHAYRKYFKEFGCWVSKKLGFFQDSDDVTLDGGQGQDSDNGHDQASPHLFRSAQEVLERYPSTTTPGESPRPTSTPREESTRSLVANLIMFQVRRAQDELLGRHGPITSMDAHFIVLLDRVQKEFATLEDVLVPLVTDRVPLLFDFLRVVHETENNADMITIERMIHLLIECAAEVISYT